jgi:3-hydroxybutyryl-CoA dehydratase
MRLLSEHKLYFEDLEIGLELETPGMTLTQTHVTLFGSMFDDLPGEPGRVPQLLPLCLSSGLGWRVPQPPLVVLAFMGFEWKFLYPARVGDTIRSVSKTVAKRTMRDGGVVVEERSIVNQRGEVLERGRLTLLVAKRPAGGGAPAETSGS